MSLGLAAPLPVLVKAKYDSAKASDALTFSPTRLTIVSIQDIQFQLRYCPSLSKKPESNDESKDEKQDEKSKPNPFHNPSPDLLIGRVPADNPTHLLVLNKYPIIAHHFILVTVEPKRQTHMLESNDLTTAFACLKEWEQYDSQMQLFAFFNSGRWSGASQRHRHVQFLPVESMRDGSPAESRWNVLTDALTDTHKSIELGVVDVPDDNPTLPPLKVALRAHPSFPTTHFAARLPEHPSAQDLHTAYSALYRASHAAVRDFIDYHPNSLSWHKDETPNADASAGGDGGADTPFSYNLSLTTTSMAMVPRRREGVMVEGDNPSDSLQLTDVGFAAVNGAVLAGTVMVREEALWEELKDEDKGGPKLQKVLEGVGIPRGALEMPRELGKM